MEDSPKSEHTLKPQVCELITSDGLKLHAQINQTPNPVALVVLVHGFGEHSGRYDHVIDLLARNNYQVLTYDHRGHGQSSGKRGYTPSIDNMLDDLNAAMNLAIKSVSTELPVILYGHSMGGGLVLNYMLSANHKPERQNNIHRIQAVLASSPWLTVAHQPPLLKRLGASLLRKLQLPITLPTAMDPKGISRDPNVVANYIADPMVHDRISPELFLGIEEKGLQTLSLADQWSKPLLICHGDADPVTLFTQSLLFAEKASINASNKEDDAIVEFKPWSGALHELHNENNASEILSYITLWLQRTIETKQK